MAIKKEFPISGMSCASCAQSVEKALAKQKGVKSVQVNFANHLAYAEFEPDETNPLALQKAVQDVGYNLEINESVDPLKELEERETKVYQVAKQRFVGSAAFALPVFVLSMFFSSWWLSPWLSMILSIPVLSYFGAHFFRTAWKLLGYGQSNMDTLVALSSGIAFLYSALNLIGSSLGLVEGSEIGLYFESAVMIIAFISFGKFLEERAKKGTSEALKKLMSLQVRKVKVIKDEKEIEMSIDEVPSGAVVMIRPGEKIPLDGKLSIGRSTVDESSISGEAIPVAKEAGDPVYAGTINQKGAFRFEVERVAGETVLDQIIKAVREAQGTKAPVQGLADRISSIFVPVVITLAVLSFGIWYFVGDGDLQRAMLSAIAVLIIACPCALGLATPTAIMVGIGKGALHQILVRDASSLEKAAQVDTLCFDKTGTLSEGKPRVLDQYWWEEDAQEGSILKAMEEQSEHPLAQSLLEELSSLPKLEAQLEIEYHAGMGIATQWQDQEYRVGNWAFVSEVLSTVPENLSALQKEWDEAGYSQVYFSAGNRLIAAYGLKDPLKEGSKALVAELKQKGFHLMILSGDRQAAVAQVAKELGINEFQAQLLPAEKAEVLQELQNQGKIVAMVGDGVNDSQALSLADLSIAMSQGADIALEVASMSIGSKELNKLPKAIALAQQTMRVIKQNLFWAFVYNIVAIPIAAGILYPINGFLINPMIGGAAMALSSVSVVLNSLRFKKTPLSLS